MASSIREAFRAEVENQGVEHLVPTYWNHLVQVMDRTAERDGVRFVLPFGSLTHPPIYADVDLLVGMDPEALASGSRSLEALDGTVDANDRLPASAAEPTRPARMGWAGGPWRSWGNRGGW